MTNSPATAPSWTDLGPSWPNHEASCFLEAGGLRWHVQVSGTGPDLLLLHGTGSATHSWSRLLPQLATRFRVIAPDLPGHGFTAAPSRGSLTLPGMATGVAHLLEVLGASPRLVVGHSAGAAVLLRMNLDRAIDPALLIGLNPALVPPPAVYRVLLAPFVHRLATSDFIAARAAAFGANPRVVDSLLRSTGSHLTDVQLGYYRRFFQSRQHVHDAFTMMSDWSLTELVASLSRISCPVTLVAGRGDYWIPLAPLRRLAALIPRATVIQVDGGHLLHEEHPVRVASLILELADRAGLP
jgi:magnesium chelatase accessory protein